MAKAGRRNRQKYKIKKKTKRDRRPRVPAVLPYHGSKYRTDDLVPFHCSVELSIHEVDVMTDKGLTDATVQSALKRMVLQIRRDALPPLRNTRAYDCDAGDLEDLIIWNIRSRLEESFNRFGHLGRDTLIGVLRSVLGSVETRAAMRPGARAYLRFLEGFIEDVGTSFRQIPAQEAERILVLP